MKDDNREGNSHNFNPGKSYPQQTSVGRGNHGGSADCTGDGAPDMDCHATANVQIYFGPGMAPQSRTYLLVDTEGSSAPYYCEPSIKTCNQADWESQSLVDPGIYLTPPIS
jgi:hypothetical protein